VPAEADRPIRFGDPIAPGYGNDPSFVHYESRSWGII